MLSGSTSSSLLPCQPPAPIFVSASCRAVWVGDGERSVELTPLRLNEPAGVR